MERISDTEMPKGNIFCQHHRCCFLEPRIEGQRVSWECPECERERYLVREITAERQKE